MDNIIEIFAWVVANWEGISAAILSFFEIAGQICLAASIICAMTPTLSDDEKVNKYGERVKTWKAYAYKFLELMAVNIGKAKQK